MTHATFLRNTFTAAALSVTALTALTGAITPAQAATQATVIVQSGPQQGIVIPAPPPPRREAVPHARKGQVWVPGYWDWRGHRHVWVAGHFEKVRPGYRYRTPSGSSATGAGNCTGAAGTAMATALPTAMTATVTATACPTAATTSRTTRAATDR